MLVFCGRDGSSQDDPLDHVPDTSALRGGGARPLARRPHQPPGDCRDRSPEARSALEPDMSRRISSWSRASRLASTYSRQEIHDRIDGPIARPITIPITRTTPITMET